MPPALVGFNMPFNGYKRDAKGRARGWQKKRKRGGVLALERNDSGRRSEDRKKKEKCLVLFKAIKKKGLCSLVFGVRRWRPKAFEK